MLIPQNHNLWRSRSFLFCPLARQRAQIAATSDAKYGVVRQDRNVKLTQKLRDPVN